MQLDLDRGGTCNRILQGLPEDDFDLLRDALTPVALPLRKRLETPSKPIDYVYFFDSGAASIVVSGPREASMCVGLVGSEGVTGLPVIMGTDRSPNETCVQFAGRAQQIAANDLKAAMAKSETLQATLLSFGYAQTNQIAQTALANGWNTIEERLARWLCMAHDRNDENSLVVTHERLGEMLGVRRPAVTVALAHLEQAGTIAVGRGSIAIVNRLRLEEKTGGMYGRAERELERVFGSAARPLRPQAILDLSYYNDARHKSQQRVGKAETHCANQREIVLRLEERGQISAGARSLLTTMESTLELMRSHLRRIERSISLELERER